MLSVVPSSKGSLDECLWWNAVQGIKLHCLNPFLATIYCLLGLLNARQSGGRKSLSSPIVRLFLVRNRLRRPLKVSLWNSLLTLSVKTANFDSSLLKRLIVLESTLSHGLTERLEVKILTDFSWPPVRLLTCPHKNDVTCTQ